MERRLRRVGAIAVLAASSLVGAGFTATQAAAWERLQLEISPRAKLVDGGRGIVLEIEASCPARHVPIEAFAYASQPDESGGGAFSNFSGIPVRCNGRTQSFVVTVHTFEGETPFRAGPANASAYLLVAEHKTGQTSSTGDSEVVEVRE